MPDLSSAVEFSFIIKTVAVILIVTAICIFLVNMKTKKIKKVRGD